MPADKLVPKQIIDVNGRPTTVHVNPDKGRPNGRLPKLPPTTKPAVTKPKDGFGTLQGLKAGIRKLHGYQNDIADKVMGHLEHHDRASASAACGMGKTVVAQELIRRHWDGGTGNSGIYLFVTDGIRLTDQSREAFDLNGVIGKHEAFVVHSQSDDFAKAKSRNPGGEDQESAEMIALTEFITKPSRYPKVIFTTYDSADKIAKVQQTVGDDYSADMTIFDESHRLSGEYEFKPTVKRDAARQESDSGDDLSPNGQVPRVSFDGINGSIQSDKRVFLTATPSFQEEYGDTYLTTKARKSKGAKGIKPWVYEVSEQALERRAQGEDARNDKTIIHLDQMNETIFGPTVASYDINYAINEAKVLTRVDRAVAPIRSRIPYRPKDGRPDFDTLRLDATGAPSENGMHASAYAAASGTLETLADGDGEAHNVLAFLPLNESTRDFTGNWKSIAGAMVTGERPSLSDARRIVDEPESHDRAAVRDARLTLIAEYAEVAYATSASSADQKSRAYHFFDDDQQMCRCGGKAAGRWCACARIVGNFDLFGQGIDIKQIDTVVQMNKNRLGDAAVTQSIGRAARKHPNKKSARVVLPMLTFDTDDGITSENIINSEMAGRALTGWSRMGRNVARAAREGRQMDPIDSEPVRILGRDETVTTTEIGSRVRGNSISAYIRHRAYAEVASSAETYYKKLSPESKAWWESASPEDRSEYIQSYAEYAVAGGMTSEFVQIVNRSRYPLWDRETANASDKEWDSVYERATQYDRDSLTEVERSMLWGDGRADKNFQIVGTGAHRPTSEDPIRAVQSYAPELAAALKEMGVDDEGIQQFAPEDHRYYRARLKQDEVRARQQERVRSGGFRV